MNEIGETTISCSSCDKKISENEIYTCEGNLICEDCAMKAGLFPLEHTGARRDKVSERGRHLTIPKY